MTTRKTLLALLVPLAWACSSGGAPGGRVAPRRDPNLITEAELQDVSVASLFDAIRTLRPEWLQRRNPTTFRPQAEFNIVVYMDRIRFGEPETLRQFPPALAASVRFLSPAEAEAEFGTGHLQGAILVATRRH